MALLPQLGLAWLVAETREYAGHGVVLWLVKMDSGLGCLASGSFRLDEVFWHSTWSYRALGLRSLSARIGAHHCRKEHQNKNLFFNVTSLFFLFKNLSCSPSYIRLDLELKFVVFCIAWAKENRLTHRAPLWSRPHLVLLLPLYHEAKIIETLTLNEQPSSSGLPVESHCNQNILFVSTASALR